MKKSFALLIAIVMISIFSYLALSILSANSLKSNNITLDYLQTQARLHQQFFKNLILEATLDCPQKLSLNSDLFEFYATFTYVIKEANCKNSHAIVDSYIKSKDETLHIQLHERFLKKL